MTIRALHADSLLPTGEHGADDGARHGAPHRSPGRAPGVAPGLAPGLASGVAGRAAPSPLAGQGGDGASNRPRTRSPAPPQAAPPAARPADPRAILRAPHGAPHGAKRRDHRDEKPDFDYVIYRLEEAGATLLALPGTGWSPRLRTSQLDIVRTALEAYGWEPPRARAPAPSAGRITRMDEALDWITLIPRDRYVLRRIVGARALVSPLTERHLFSWRRLGVLLGADHKAIQRWHGEGVRLIVAALGGT